MYTYTFLQTDFKNKISGAVVSLTQAFPGCVKQSQR